MPGFELFGKEEKDAISEVLDNGGILLRHGFDQKRKGIFKVKEFEAEVAKKFNVQFCHAVSSGTAALHCSLLALGVKPGDEVITQCHTFVATVEAILLAGAKPVLTEVDKSLNMDPLDLEKKITEKTKVIIPVHMAGVPARMDEIMAIAKKHNIAVLEDSAQLFGGKYKGKYLGTIGDAGIFSFDYAKALTTGEGGMVITNKEDIYRTVREFSDHGHEQNLNLPRGEDTHKIWGTTYRMMELQGALGVAQFKKLDFIIEQQRKNKKRIKDGIKDLSGIEFRDIPAEEGDTADTLIFFLENSEKASKFVKLFAEKGFGTKNLPDAINWHFAGMWSHIFKDTSVWPESEKLLKRAIALPIMVKMDDEEINNIIEAIKECLKN